MKVLVTGAAGFIGRAVVAELHKQSHHVIALVRKPEQKRMFLEVDVVVADVTESTADLANAMREVDVVIHLAGVVWGGTSQMQRTMVDGTANLIEAMRQVGVTRLILASSFSVYDWSQVNNTLTESAALADEGQTQQGPYSRAKVLQESTARRLCKEYGVHLTILRPAAVVASDNFDTADLGPRQGPLQLVIAPFRRLRLVKLEHVAAAFAAACSTNIPDGLVVNLVDDEPVSAWQLANRIRRDRGGAGLLLPLPYYLLMGGARVFFPLCKLLGLVRFLPGLLIPDRLACRFKSVTCDNSVWRRYLPSPATASSQ